MSDEEVVLKKVKDFSAEERAAILARLKRIEPTRVAKEFNTTWQVVVAIERAEKRGTSKKKTTKAKAAARKNTKSKASAAREGRKAAASERRAAILARAEEIGVTEAANEAGISKWTVFQWRKALKKAGVAVAPLRRRRSAVSKRAVKTKVKKVTPVVAADVPAVEKKKKSGVKATASGMSLEYENMLLKEKVNALTEQVEKLRSAIAKLA